MSAEKCPRCGADPSDKAGNQFHSAQCLLNSKIEALQRRVEELEVMRQAALELAQYASYAEIVGRVSLNKDQIREWSDKIFKLNLDLGDAMPRKGGK